MNTWRKGCESAHCVEVKFKDGSVLIRDSKETDGPVLVFTLQEWKAFTEGVISGEFD